MASSRTKSTYWRGFREGAPFILAATPFAMVYGVVAIESGFSAAQAMGFSVLVIAGAAQLAALQLMTEAAPFLVVVATALAVNLRMAMYSASLAPHLGAAPLWQRMLIAYINFDQSYAMSMAQYEAEAGLSLPEKVAYFFGVASPVFAFWYLGSAAGVLAGQTIPETLSLDFIVPITFLAIASVMLRTAAHWIAAGVSVAVALLLHGLPYNLGLLLAAFAAMIAGAVAEARAARS